LCGSLSRSVRETLEAQGAIVGSIRISSVDALERGGTGKAPLILAKRGA
jgi:hypothetical protein